MSGLFSSELLRARSRRIVRVVAIGALVGIGASATIVAVQSHAGNYFALSNSASILQGTAFLVIIGGWVLGASLVGAEWSEGTFATLLTWEPRRLRVLFVRAVVVAAVVFVLAVVLQAVLVGVLALVATTRGDTTTGSGFLRELVGIGVRVAGAASLGGVLGLSIAMLTRSTAASVGAGFAYLGIVEHQDRGHRTLPGRHGFLH